MIHDDPEYQRDPRPNHGYVGMISRHGSVGEPECACGALWNLSEGRCTFQAKVAEARRAGRKAAGRGLAAALKTRVDGPSVHAEPQTGSGAGRAKSEGPGGATGPSPVDVGVGTDAAKRTVNVGLCFDMRYDDAKTLRDMLTDGLDYIDAGGHRVEDVATTAPCGCCPDQETMQDVHDVLCVEKSVLRGLRQAEAERDELRRQVQAVRELHRPYRGVSDYDTCEECSVIGCPAPWPCPTIQAIGGTA